MDKIVISSCWRPSRVLGPPEQPDAAPVVILQEGCEQSFEHASELVSAKNRTDVRATLSTLNEDGCVQDTSVVSDFEAAMPKRLIERDGMKEKDAIGIPSLRKKLHAICVLRRVTYFSDTVGDTFVSSLRRLHADIMREPSKSALQTKIDSFFT